ncbi:MAG TPA: 6-phosphogluconolactonase [Pyrinomonadaceae bacterium]|nr:6-phosphogluconolactonase [Pyrinomonadaceae bacterium]
MPADERATPDIQIFADAGEVARAAALRFVELARASINTNGRFSVALAGGSTPKRIYELLAGSEFAAQLYWPGVHVFFGDERSVPPDDADSNYRMANEALLSRVALPEENVHRMRGEGDAVANARLYEDELRGYFGDDANWPEFDLVMLGMGDDGHTASLFPGTRALDANAAWVTANWVDKFDAYRVTLTAQAINHARHVMFIVTGAGKAARLQEVLYGSPDTQRLPSQLIQPRAGALTWFIDEAAAAKLNGKDEEGTMK